MKMRTRSSREALKEEYKSTCKKVKELVRRTRFEFEKILISESKSNPKLVYSYIKSERKTKERIRSLINDECEIIVNKRGIANLLSEKFQRLLTRTTEKSSQPLNRDALKDAN